MLQDAETRPVPPAAATDQLPRTSPELWHKGTAVSSRRSMILMTRVVVASVVGLGILSGALAAPPGRANGDEPSFHVLSAQDLCNLIWPSSQAMPDPSKFGAVCVRQGGVFLPVLRALPSLVSNPSGPERPTQ